MHSTSEMGVTNVPAFLTKLWTLVEDPTTDEFIAWDSGGQSFHVLDQARFAKEILPLYFKHNNMASFIRQLNMYGFRKVIHIDNGSMKSEKDDVEFHHQYFQRDREDLLENIKRKQSTVNMKTEPGVKWNPDDVNRVLTDVKHIKGKQDNITSKMDTLKKENEALWREVASLRQKHMKQQQIVNKLIQFMVHLVGGNRELANNMKRKMPLMISDAGPSTPGKKAKYGKQLSVEELKDPYRVNSPQDYLDQGSGPIIHDVTDVLDASSPAMSSHTRSPVTATTANSFTGSNLSITPTKPQATSSTMATVPMTTPGGAFSPALRLPLSPPELSGGNQSDLLDESLDSSYLTNLVGEGSLLQTSQDESSGQLDRLLRDLPQRHNPTIVLPNELTGAIDNMQDDIDHLKDLLSSNQYSIDTNVLLGILSGEENEQQAEATEAPSNSTATATTAPPDPGTITGNELISFNYIPPDLLLSPFADWSDMASTDMHGHQAPLGVGEGDHIDPMSLINTSNTPLPLEDDLNLD